MAGPVPINPQTAAQSDPGLFDKWRSWLVAPQNQAALLQTGLSLMAPVQPGQSQFGHIASSIGQGLGAAGRTEARLRNEDLQQQKLNRELSADELDREIKRTGLELDKEDTKSLIGQRNAGIGIDQARLGLDKSKSGLEARKTEAEIANLTGKGTVTLSDMFKASKDIAEISSTTGEPIEAVTQKYLDAQKVLSTAMGGGQSGQSGAATAPGVSPPAPTSTYPTITTPEAYAALPSGTIFMAPDKSLRRKP